MARPNRHPTSPPKNPRQLLTEMDGVDGRAGVYLIAATNRPDIIDPALLRPGRLDKMLYVPLPDPGGRASILTALTRGTPLHPDVRLPALAASPRLEGFSGADLAALVREACVAALKEQLASGGAAEVVQGPAGAEPGPPPLVLQRHLEQAMQTVQPSVSRRDRAMYDRLRNRLRSARGHIVPEVRWWVMGGVGRGRRAGVGKEACGWRYSRCPPAKSLSGSNPAGL